MKLIIDIPEELYRAYKDRPPMLGDAGIDMIAQSIANGTPLDDIKAEIESKTHPDYTGHNEYEMAVSDGYEGALLIIDKHISGEDQGKENE